MRGRRIPSPVLVIFALAPFTLRCSFDTDQNTDATGGAGGTALSPEPANCPDWPLKSLFPFLGAGFYGPDPGPCTANALKVQYDAENQPTGTYSSGGVQQSSFSFDGGILSRQIVHPADQPSADTMTYTYAYNNPFRASRNGIASNSVSPYAIEILTYVLDSKGYPQSADYSTNRTAPVHEDFGYDSDCHLVTGVYSDPVRLNTNKINSFSYDAEGHLVSGNVIYPFTYDYSCWPH